MSRSTLAGALARAALLSALVLPFAMSSAGCSSSGDTTDESDDPLAGSKLTVSVVRSAATYKALSIEGTGFGQAGRSMKFLIDNRDATKRSIYFVNGNYKVNGQVPEYAQYHYYFARHQLQIGDDNSSFNDSTYFVEDKRFYAGTIQTYMLGDATTPLYAVQLYPDDVASEQTILTALQVIKDAFKIPGAKMAFVATGPQQTTSTVADPIHALGFEIDDIEHLLGSVKYFPMNPGEAWGYLRIFPKDVGDLRPTDIPVFDEQPLDLSVVAGVMTRAFQDATSHVNLKSKERGTPDMVFRDAAPGNARLAPFADKPVHLVVKKDDFAIEPSTDAEVQAKLAARLAKPWITLPVIAETKLASYDEMCPAASSACLDLTSRYGGKATGLGFLANKSVLGRVGQSGSLSKKMGYDLVPLGFGVPVQGYRDFVNDPANAALKAKIDAFVAKEKTASLSPNERVTLLTEIQSLFYTAKLDPQKLAALRARITEVVPGVPKLKIRSSSNAEDVPNFDGAGLYDSFSAEPATADNADGSCAVVVDPASPTKSKVSPKTVQCAVKAVYASLWNPRAVEERSFARLDHATSGMGLAIVPAYDYESDIVGNSVIITRVLNSEDVIGYSVSVQKDDNLVTNPDPGTIAENEVATFSAIDRPTHFTLARYATPKAGKPALTTPVLPNAKLAEMVDVVKAVEIAYCRANPDYYQGNCDYVWLDNTKPKSLDMEIKVLANGHLVAKQAREFHGQ